MSKPVHKAAQQEKQARRFRRAALVALVHRDLSVTALSKALGLPRSTVSRAIHTGRFPHVRRAIADKLAI